jgi:hypothetical protein
MGGDWGELALVSRAEQWVASNPYFFIVSTAKLVRPRTVVTGTVASFPAIRIRDALFPPDDDKTPVHEIEALPKAGEVPVPKDGRAREPTGAFRLHNGTKVAAKDRGIRPLVLPLRKVQETFPSMITLGRTDINDIVVPDAQVSKCHAFFRVVGSRVELSDAGSRNGTLVAGRRLEPRGSAVVLESRDVCSFAGVEFQLFDSRGCWEFLHQLQRF